MAAVLPPAPLVGTLPPSPTTENLERLKSVLAGSGNRTRISVSDGRTFFGHFMCVDRDRNVVLGGTEELRGEQRRFVGLVTIPGKHIVNIAVPKDIEA